MTRRITKSFIDKNTKKRIKAGTKFTGSDERFKELEKRGYAETVSKQKEKKKNGAD